MKNLIIVAHPDKQSFCQNGIQKTIADTLEQNKEDFYICIHLLFESNRVAPMNFIFHSFGDINDKNGLPSAFSYR